MRLFAALVPPPAALEHLEEFLDVRRDAGNFRWVQADQVHVTRHAGVDRVMVAFGGRLQDLGDVLLELGVRHGDDVVVRRVGVPDAGQHVRNRVGHSHVGFRPFLTAVSPRIPRMRVTFDVRGDE